ncbi:hypothetical protein [Dyella solisilvae]|nr:hypothetical protein [Dyella solisilvae]
MSFNDGRSNSLRESKIGLTVLMILFVSVAGSRGLATRKVGDSALPPVHAAGIELRALSPLPLSPASQSLPFHGVASCNLGYIAGRKFGPGDETVSSGVVGLGGWVVDEVNHRVPSEANLVFFDDQAGQGFSISVTNWLTRPDVQDSHGGLAAFRKPGFVEEADLAYLPVGRYHVYMTFNAGNWTYTCDNGRFINLIHGR